MDSLDTLDLPAGTHARLLTGRDVVTGLQLAYPVIWADRPYDRCPRCDQPVARVVDQCPVTLDTGAGQGGRIGEWDQQHGCGEWLGVAWAEVDGDPTEDDVVTAARQLAEGLAEAIAGQRASVRARLAQDLREAMGRLAEPLEDGETAEERAAEIRTGNEVESGIYLEDGSWVAWDYAPAGDGDTIAVHEADLDEQAPRA